MLSVLEASLSGFLPNKLNETLTKSFANTSCPYCQTPLYLTYDLNQIYCNNGTCPGKIADRLMLMFETVGEPKTPFAVAQVVDMTTKYKLQSPFEFLDTPLDAMDKTIFENVQKQLLTYRETEHNLADFLSFAALPYIKDTQFIANYPSLEVFYDDLSYGGLSFVTNILGITDINVYQAIPIYKSLITYKNELCSHGVRYHIKSIKSPLYVYVHLLNTTETYTAYWENIQCQVNATIVLQGSLSPRTQIVVADDTIPQYMDYKCDENNVPILESDQLLDYLTEEY